MSESEDERIDYELDRFMEGRGYTCSVAAAKVNELEAENERLTEWNLNAQSLNGLLELRHSALQAELQRLKALNHRLNTEYNKTWDVLRTYNPKDTELEYIGFETVEVLDAPNQ